MMGVLKGLIFPLLFWGLVLYLMPAVAQASKEAVMKFYERLVFLEGRVYKLEQKVKVLNGVVEQNTKQNAKIQAQAK